MYNEYLSKSSILKLEVNYVSKISDWRTPIIQYIKGSLTKKSEVEYQKIAFKAKNYCLMDSKLYRRYLTEPPLRCVSKEKVDIAIVEVHSGIGRGTFRNLRRTSYVKKIGTENHKTLDILANNEEGLRVLYIEMQIMPALWISESLILCGFKFYKLSLPILYVGHRHSGTSTKEHSTTTIYSSHN